MTNTLGYYAFAENSSVKSFVAPAQKKKCQMMKNKAVANFDVIIENAKPTP